METYSLLKTIPVFEDVRLRVWRSYHSLKHVHRLLRLGLQLVEIFFQLCLLFSWPLIILCYIPIIVTDRFVHHFIVVLITFCPFLTRPANEIYEAVLGFILSLTIGRVAVFIVLFISFFVFFIIECLKIPINIIKFFFAPLTDDEVFSPRVAHCSGPFPWSEDYVTSARPTYDLESTSLPQLQPCQAIVACASDNSAGLAEDVAPADSATHSRADRSPAGQGLRRGGSRARVGVDPRRGPGPAAGRVASPSSSSKASEDDGADGAGAALRRSVTYRLRRRRSVSATAGPNAGPLAWTRSLTLGDAAAQSTAPASEASSGTDSKTESQYDVTDAQRIIVSSTLNPIPQELQESLRSPRDENWYDALSTEYTEAETRRQSSASPQSTVETRRDALETRRERGGAHGLAIAVPRLRASQTSASSRQQHSQSIEEDSGALRRRSAVISSQEDTSRPSLAPLSSARATTPTQQSTSSSNE